MASLSDKDHHITSFYHDDHGGSSPSSDQGSYGYDHDYQKSSVLLDEEANSLMETTNSTTATDVIVNHGTTTTFHTPVGLTDLGFRPHNGHQQSLINFKNGDGRSDCFGHSTAAGSFLSFQQDHKNIDSFLCGSDNNVNGIMGCYSNTSYNSRQVISNDLKGGSSESRLFDDINSYQPASSSYGWLYSDATVVAADRVQETGTQEGSTAVLKRPYTGDQRSIQTSKKQCTGIAKNSKPKPVPSTKDPQSIAAKNRRERISERLKILQELVPNGPKVDLVTMLEKAISYVKFLQLQVKVLATDEFWPAQGGKAPDISQVKEAIDAILTSQRDRSSSSK